MNKNVLQLILAFALIAQGWLVHAQTPHMIDMVNTAAVQQASNDVPPCHQPENAEKIADVQPDSNMSYCCGDDCSCAAQCGVIASYVTVAVAKLLDEPTEPSFIATATPVLLSAHKARVPRPPNS